jgi:hemolysin-activating ACP:hemolysin acyltransferase
MDHERVNIHTTSMSCGVLELSRISADIEDVLYAIATRLYHPARGEPAAFIVWSDIVTETTLADVVDTKKFGKMTTSYCMDNPKTGNPIVVFTWAIYHEPFKAWYSRERVARIKKVGA